VSFYNTIKLDSLVYLSDPSGIFFINKIEQYKANKPVRVELIDISTQELEVIISSGATGFVAPGPVSVASYSKAYSDDFKVG